MFAEAIKDVVISFGNKFSRGYENIPMPIIKPAIG